MIKLRSSENYITCQKSWKFQEFFQLNKSHKQSWNELLLDQLCKISDSNKKMLFAS